nr:DNA gyrase subunit B [bacterium]
MKTDMGEYKASDIQVLEGLEAVRRRPGMYIGSTDARGLHHILWEIVDNAVDEAANGYATQILVTLHADGSASVEDNGRGIPTGIHPQLGVSGVEVVYTQLHAGAKFDNRQYGYSGGLHGVGASVVNALSEWLVCEVGRDGRLWRQEFRTLIDEKTGKVLAGHPMGPLEDIGPTRRKGTRTTFMPDATVFEEASFSFDKVERHLREVGFLNAGVRIVLTDERVKEDGKPKKREFLYAGGLSDFVSYLNEGKNPLHPVPITLEGEKDGISVSCAIQYTDGYTESLYSYVNNIPTAEGGTHETGFKAALTRVFNDYARQVGILKEKDANLSGEDFREGITVVLALKMHSVQFEGQTKTKLGNSEARPAVEAVIAEKLQLWLEDIKNSLVAAAILEKAAQSARVREAARRAKETARRRSSIEGAQLVGKLAASTGKKPELNELFIVEGDSAGGTAKQARKRQFQAIMPLRGKPLNAEKKRLDEVLENQEFRTIIAALGCGIDEDFSIDALKYHKIIILSDADQDGAHIRSILLTFFFRYMKDLITAGHVYIGQPPLYKVSRGKVVRYCYDDKELAIATKEIGRGYALQR